MNPFKIKYIAFYSLCFTILIGCAKQNAGIVKQTYHDLTGHYNTYFNGNEIYKEAIASAENSRTEDYDNILPLYAYGTPDDTKGQQSQFETAIEKAERTVQLHQEKQKGKNFDPNGENSITNWADDAFLLIGKSYFMIGEYDKAIRSLRYITANFMEGVDARSDKKIKKQRGNKKKKKKDKKKSKKLIELEKKGKDIRPSKSLFEHEAAKSEALVWLVKSYTASDEYEKAESVLTFIKSDQTFLKDFDPEVALAEAALKLKQGKYENAIPSMERALENINNQKRKSRYQFVLAQLYEETGNNSMAANYYNQSIKGNPNFEMAFYAKFKLIQMSHNGGYDESEALKLITKLLKDNKNKAYNDLLYYEKALFALEDNNRPQAKEYLRESIKRSIDNTNQKAKSYLLLAELNYEEEQYEIAQGLYDSTLQIIGSDYENYDFILNRSNVLTELVTHLNTIFYNDSIIELASMPQKEREDFLYELAIDMVEAEVEAEAKKQNELALQVPVAETRGSKKSWYFYSESAKSNGFKKFQQKWGERVLEDNWRRADKSSGDIANDDTSNEPDKDDFFERVDLLYQTLLGNVPTEKNEIDQLHAEIIDGFYGAAVTYRLGLENLPKSASTFETLLKRYPENKHELPTYYNLYLIYDLMGNDLKAQKYKDLVLEEYPKSEFADLIRNPNKMSDSENTIAAVDAYYKSSYSLYQEGKYDAAITAAEEADSIYPGNYLQPKFDLLKAIAIGQKQLYDPYVNSLKYVIQTHKNTEEEAKAKELLAYLKGEIPGQKEESVGDKIKNKQKGQLELNTTETEKTKGAGLEDNKAEDENEDGLKIKFGNKEVQIGGDKLKKDPE